MDTKHLSPVTGSRAADLSPKHASGPSPHKTVLAAACAALCLFTANPILNITNAADLNPAPDSAARLQDPELRSAVDRVIQKMGKALVRIQVVSTDYREGREIKMQAVGSGAIISEDGYLVTNHHVAGHARRMICTLWNREEVEAELVGTDALTDVAVLKLLPVKPRKFDFVQFGDSSTIKAGDPVLAMGSPMALSQSVTLGIISNVEMVMPKGRSARMELDGEDVGSLVKWIGHDAAIYGGNSGGPLLDLTGKIIGVNEISFGLSGAIPGNIARKVADELIAKGKVTRSWLGIDVQPLFKHAEGQKGVIVGGVIEGSPAQNAGLKPGDLLLSVNNQPTNARYDEQMPAVMQAITGLPIGREVSLTLLRAGKEISTNLTPVERGEVYLKEQELKEWGLTARDISFLEAKERKRSNRAGVLVTSVRPGGPSGDAKPALGLYDVIVEVDGKKIAGIEDLKKVTETVLKDKEALEPVTVGFERDASRYLTVVSVGIQEMRNPGLELRKAWLPIETGVISRDLAREMKKPELKGFYITRVYAGHSADKASLRVGDMIFAVDGEKLTADAPEHAEEFAALMRQYDIGAEVELSILRGTETLNVKVPLERSPQLQREMKKYRSNDFEFTARDVSFFDRAQEQWPATQTGALVEEVKSGSWAELGNMLISDLIVEVEGQTIKDVAQLKEAMDKVASDKRKFVVMKVLRGIHTLFLELEPTWKTAAQ